MALDSDSDEDFVSYGTPLEPLEEDEPLKKPLPLHEQTVKDEKGRYQRFHGAFTGGFSAGYFNTVGSKEGWAPSGFVSSRQQKAEKLSARPEDFMDEEDFSEHGIAPRQITTSHEFSSSRRDDAQEKAKAVSAQTALIPGDTLLEELISPAKSSIGVELLRKMGWKEGQGVGPRLKRKARRQQTNDGGRVYGCALPPAGSEESENDDDEFAPENVTFAPKDVTPVDFSPRLGVQGLGYHGLNPGLALLGRSTSEHIDLFNPQSNLNSRLFGDAQRQSRRGGVAGQAFGIGALEDDDDEDVYHRDSLSRYDTVLGGEEPGDGLYGWTAPQQYTKKKDQSKDASYLGKILEGFTLTQKPAEEKTVFLPPSLPKDYRPIHRFQPAVISANVPGISPALAKALRMSRGHMVQEEPQHRGRHQLDSDQRRALLGEETLQGPVSVLDLLRPEDRRRLLNLRNSSNLPYTKSDTTVPDASCPVGVSVPMGVAFTGLQQQQQALASWKGAHGASQAFKPFENNPSKQARYDLYLNRLKQGDKDALEQSLDPGMTEWEQSREREEFVRASILYRPSSSSLSSRFTRAKHQEDDDVIEVNNDQEGVMENKQTAVKMKMFGKLTRETFEWHPDKLLCKRFNVPDPYPGSGAVGLPKVKRDKFSVFNFLTVADNSGTQGPPKPPASGKKSRWDVSDRTEKKADLLSSQQPPESKDHQSPAPALPGPASPEPRAESADEMTMERKKEDEDEPEEEESRPPMDLFKAIFASSSDEKSSSSEEDSHNEDDDQTKDGFQTPNLFNITSTTAVTSTTVTPSSSAVTSTTVTPSSSAVTSTTVTPSSSAVTSTTATPSSSAVTSTTATPSSSAVTSSSQQTGSVSKQEQEEFGPKLPPLSCAHARGGATIPGEEVKVSTKSKDRKHKNKKHYKHKKEKKKKHKKKKHKGKQRKSKETNSNSDDSDEDGQMTTEELLKRLKSVRSQQT
ncbi:G patch domain-containing protein 1 [Thalassophryne amazonica]|uniref:G patch domain-containing protein 1 n=1 Tax=Thalassophryne amazonica TaxID=390379 RepID=UPI0014724250|nr:G patch domain-containing protein 1 [Thalassophryne amazonica]